MPRRPINPLRFQQLSDYFEHAALDFQRACLQALEKYEDQHFIERLAANFLAANPPAQEKDNLTMQTESATAYHTVEELQKIAFLNQTAGQKEAALQAIQQAFAELNASQAKLMCELAREVGQKRP